MTETARRVVILGSGPSALTAAWQLTDPALNGRYAVTIYQMGWRSGGLCASGRVLPEYWINQNGTHYLFGCYTNSLRMGREVYAYLESIGDTRFGTFDEQLIPRNLIVVSQFFKGNWTKWALEMPENGELPGARAAQPSSKLMSGLILLKHTLHYLLTEPVLAELETQEPAHHSRLGELMRGIGHELGSIFSHSIKSVLDWVLKIVQEALQLADKLHLERLLHGLVDVLVGLRSLLQKIIGDPRRDSLIATRIWLLVDLGLTVAIGYIQDRAYTEEGLAALDEYDFRDWLRTHGAEETSVMSPPVTVWYDAIAAYDNGDVRRGSCAAGASLITASRLLNDYHGSVAYQLKNEIADSMIAPLYAALVHRGVRFAYFHRVWDIVPGADGRIAKVVLEQQAQTISGNPFAYDPFIHLPLEPKDKQHPQGGRPVWPDEPNYDQIILPKSPQIAHLTKRALDGEPQQSPDSLGVLLLPDPKHKERIPIENPTHPLHPVPELVGPAMDSYFYPRLGPDVELLADRDFDILLSGLGFKMYPSSAPSLLAQSERWRTAVEKVGATETQSLRLWFLPELPALGWNLGAPILSAYAQPYSTWEDPTPCLLSEYWPASNQPKTVSHLFGPLLGSGELPSMTDRGYVRRQFIQAYCAAGIWTHYVVGSLWPGATRPGYPLVLDGATLAAIQVRANAGPEQMYTQVIPGTAKYRLEADQTGYRNMLVCGDWTKTELLTGCEEGAVMSGLNAAAALIAKDKAGAI